jgi:hypothetical protein
VKESSHDAPPENFSQRAYSQPIREIPPEGSVQRAAGSGIDRPKVEA